jgi:5-methylcytosine-specific restriction enzyme A
MKAVPEPTNVDEIARALNELGGRATAKQIKDRVTDNRGGIPSQYGGRHSYRETIQKKIEDHCPESSNFKGLALFRRVKRGLYELIASETEDPVEFVFPEEVDSRDLVEGAAKRVTVNAYERNSKAREECIAAHKAKCCVCKFDFGVAYGPEFTGFIHVHHLRAISEIGGEYIVDPIRDLCPVCPNCHAIIHYGRRVRSIEEVKQLLSLQKQIGRTST